MIVKNEEMNLNYLLLIKKELKEHSLSGQLFCCVFLSIVPQLVLLKNELSSILFNFVLFIIIVFPCSFMVYSLKKDVKDRQDIFFRNMNIPSKSIIFIKLLVVLLESIIIIFINIRFFLKLYSLATVVYILILISFVALMDFILAFFLNYNGMLVSIVEVILDAVLSYIFYKNQMITGLLFIIPVFLLYKYSINLYDSKRYRIKL